jgi:CBS domain-containing protein
MQVERILPIALERLITIPHDGLLMDAAKRLSGTHRSLVVVCNPEGVMVGVITTDIVRQIAHCQGISCTMPATTVMTPDVTYCHPSDVLQDVLSIMKERGFVHIPIVDQDSRPSGVLNVRDALRALLGEAEYDVSFIRDYIMGIGYH